MSIAMAHRPVSQIQILYVITVIIAFFFDFFSGSAYNSWLLHWHDLRYIHPDARRAMTCQRIHGKGSFTRALPSSKRLLGIAALCLLMTAADPAGGRYHADVEKQTVVGTDVPYPLQFSQAVGSQCQTKSGICPLSQPGPIGWPCYCGQEEGTIVQ
jgi:hypothetical protein